MMPVWPRGSNTGVVLTWPPRLKVTHGKAGFCLAYYSKKLGKLYKVLSGTQYGSNPRSISTAQLNELPHFHMRPIKQVVFL